METNYLGTPVNFTLTLKEGDKRTGDFEGDKLEGTVTRNAVRFLAKDDQEGSEDATGTLQGDSISGTVSFINGSNPTHPNKFAFTAKLAVPQRLGTPQRHAFTPTTFYRQFSPHNKPVLTVNPGDTIHSTTVDAGGTDEKGIDRVLGGNPETGPFYVEGAFPGDTLRDATSNMAEWLTDDYKLTPSEVAQVPGNSTEYKVSELADRNVGIVLKINKDRLQTLTPATK